MFKKSFKVKFDMVVFKYVKKINDTGQEYTTVESEKNRD